MFVYYHVFEITGNSKGGQVIPFYVLLSFLVCIKTDSKFQTGAALFKTALKVELFSCFDGRRITRTRKRILAVANVGDFCSFKGYGAGAVRPEIQKFVKKIYFELRL